MSFDTTSSNTGSALGVCELLGRPFVHLACRHHVLELVAEAAFATSFGPSTGPDIAIFKRFQSSWRERESRFLTAQQCKNMPFRAIRGKNRSKSDNQVN